MTSQRIQDSPRFLRETDRTKDLGMTEFRTVTKVSEISPGQMRVFEVNGDEVVVANVGSVYYAFDNTCLTREAP